jgi:hypothetical protein
MGCSFTNEVFLLFTGRGCGVHQGALFGCCARIAWAPLTAASQDTVLQGSIIQDLLDEGPHLNCQTRLIATLSLLCHPVLTLEYHVYKANPTEPNTAHQLKHTTSIPLQNIRKRNACVQRGGPS